MMLGVYETYRLPPHYVIDIFRSVFVNRPDEVAVPILIVVKCGRPRPDKIYGIADSGIDQSLGEVMECEFFGAIC